MVASVYQTRKYDATIWGPRYWFFLHTLALTYPEYPNDVSMRKYYDFIQNLPIFLPDEKIGMEFSDMLDKYPVTPYLDNRDSFLRWTVFIHNKVNVLLGKPELELEEAMRLYDMQYVPEKLDLYGDTEFQRKVVYMNMAILLALLLVAYMVYF